MATMTPSNTTTPPHQIAELKAHLSKLDAAQLTVVQHLASELQRQLREKTNTQSLLMRLPAELRNNIYALAIHAQLLDWFPKRGEGSCTVTVGDLKGLLGTCRALSKECEKFCSEYLTVEVREHGWRRLGRAEIAGLGKIRVWEEPFSSVADAKAAVIAFEKVESRAWEVQGFIRFVPESGVVVKGFHKE